MPYLSQIMIRTALIWLAVGYTIGGLVLFNKGVPFLPQLWMLRTTHVHLLLVGWTVQLACGVAFWILPRLDARGDRGNEQLVWLCYFTLNSGVVLAALTDPLALWLEGTTRRVLPVLAGGLYGLAAIAFVLHVCRRVLPFRILPRSTETG